MTERKTALITGASKGIGRELAIGLAQDGYNVVLTARSQDLLKGVLEEIKSKNPNTAAEHIIHALDVTDFAQVRQVIKDTVDKYGRIDVLVNNAGTYTTGTFALSVEEFEYQQKVNLTAPFVFMQEVVPVMKRQKDGYIINIASRAGKIGFATDGGYVAGKFGLVGLNESVYRELSTYGIRVTALCPGWTNTAMAYEAGTPLAGTDMIQPADILKTVRWLLNLSPSVRIKELVMECKDSIE